jgi:hypothetical protein
VLGMDWTDRMGKCPSFVVGRGRTQERTLKSDASLLDALSSDDRHYSFNVASCGGGK